MVTRRRKRELPLHLMLLPGLLLLLVYNYIPMAGLVMAFQKYEPLRGFLKSKWVNLENFQYLFVLPDFTKVLYNTVFISVMKIISCMVVSIVVALLLNEVRSRKFQRTIQTSIYLPYFISWVLLAGIMLDLLSPNEGMVNGIIKAMGFQPIYFLGDNRWFQAVIIISGTWQTFGFNTVIYLAALMGIDPCLYESAVIDGANRWRQTLHITLPGMMPIIILLLTLSLGSIFNAGFDQIFNLYSPSVYESGDILDTMIYRIGLLDTNYSLATAIGMFKSVISAFLIATSYWLAYRFANYRIF